VPKQYELQQLMGRAIELENEGSLKLAAHYYLFCVQQFRYDALQQEHVAECLGRLAAICERGKKIDEALKYRHAQKLVYESRLLFLAEQEQETKKKQRREARAAAAASRAATAAASDDTKYDDDDADAAEEDAAATASMIKEPPLAADGTETEEERKAEQFMQLAKVFFAKNNVPMAKSYIRKAIEQRHLLKKRLGDRSTMSAQQRKFQQMALLGRKQYQQTLDVLSSDGTDAFAATTDAKQQQTRPQMPPEITESPEELYKALQMMGGDQQQQQQQEQEQEQQPQREEENALRQRTAMAVKASRPAGSERSVAHMNALMKQFVAREGKRTDEKFESPEDKKLRLAEAAEARAALAALELEESSGGKRAWSFVDTVNMILMLALVLLVSVLALKYFRFFGKLSVQR
jgi:hypothetical protein